MPNVSEEGLIRGIRRWDLVAIAINGIIGAGIFGLPSKVFSLIGPYSLIAFVACALVVTLIILCFAEVGSRFNETGGPYLYAREAFGSTVAFEVGWLMWLARVTAFAANCNLLVIYLGYFWPAATGMLWRTTIITLMVTALATINVFGVREAAVVSNCFTIGKLIPMLIFIAVGLFFLNPQAYALGEPPTTGAFSQSVLLLIYAFTGFEMATIPAGEIKNPQKYLPRALMIAIAVVAVLYILIQVVCVGTLPDLAQSQKPLADAGTRFMGWAGGALIAAGAVISITGNLNILLLSGSRIPFAIAERQQLPSFFAKVHQRFFTPYVAILVTAAVMLLLTLKSSFIAALTISAIARLVTYAATCAALPVFRRRANAPPAMFRLPAGTLIAILSLVLAVWLLSNSTWVEARATAIAAAIGPLIYLTNFFSMEGRLNRAKYFWRLLAIGLVTEIVAFAAGILLWMTMGKDAEQMVPIVSGVILLEGTVISAFQVVKRLHDLDRPGTSYWWLLIPLYNIYFMVELLFKKGTDGPNQYGEDPLARSPIDETH